MIYLYVVPFFPSQSSWRGGFFLDVAKALIRDGRFDVRVMVCSGGKDYEIEGIHVYCFDRFRLGCSDYFNSVTNFVKIRQFRRKLAEMGVLYKAVAVCHVHLLLEQMAIYATWMKRKSPRCVTLIHHHLTGENNLGYERFTWLPFVKEVQYLRLRRDFELADMHIFCSRQAESAYSRFCRDKNLAQMIELRKQLAFSWMYSDFKFKRSYVLYNGYDSKLFYEKHERTDSGGWRVGCVGNFTESKSQITLIRAFQRVHAQMVGAELIFVGSGKTLQMCIDCAKAGRGGSCIAFRQEMPHELLPAFYQSLNLYVLPSYWEAFNCSLVEAWACGVPCMATDAISFKEVLPLAEQAEWLFPEKNERRLAERLLWAYKNHPPRQKLIKNLDVDLQIKTFLCHLQEVFPELRIETYDLRT